MEVKQEMEQQWPVRLVIDFMSAVEDGQGHWKPGLYADEGHPNDEGHKIMFE